MGKIVKIIHIRMTQPAYGLLLNRGGRIERSNPEWIEVLVDIATLLGHSLTS